MAAGTAPEPVAETGRDHRDLVALRSAVADLAEEVHGYGNDYLAERLRDLITAPKEKTHG